MLDDENFNEMDASNLNNEPQNESEVVESAQSSPVTDNLFCELPEVYFSENSGLSLSSFTFITSKPDTPVLEYINDNVDADILNSLVIVTSVEEADEISVPYPNLNTIPVFIGRISSSVKDIEL